eukprot:TRINITY_DN65136_c0_g1_i2.p2 TRINITY_DN65136_c0_g1~~TRINITY_DN65136_c0_g1_i2.p2  ORF type:complete len:140 (+),score=27.99 TRINITY_DN65136_c0_g1_i2:99-518(+)
MCAHRCRERLVAARAGPSPAGAGNAGGRWEQAGFSFGGSAASGDRCGGGSFSGPGARPWRESGAGTAVAAGTPEAEVAKELSVARAEGPNAVHRCLRRLLLRWHPDKLPQGDGPDAATAKEEATRVLRFILAERERLGL